MASKIRNPSSPSIATSAKSMEWDDARAADSKASNCRCESPSVGKFGWDVGAADVVGGRVLENPVDHAGAVEARHY
ncbi:hypothetical protein ABZ914_10770 [Spirillospora sp. NPDC046719]